MSDTGENDNDDVHRPRREKRTSSYKAKAFEKFKQLKSGARKKYEVEELEDVYETVDEREYMNRVLTRQDDDWIVDDDGSGYVEDGRDIFDDDLDSESIAKAKQMSQKVKGVKRKKKDVSEQAGKGNLQYMISNMPKKKKEEKKIDDDEALSELLGEIDEGPSASFAVKAKPANKSTDFKLGSQMVKNYMKTFKQPQKIMKKSLKSTKDTVVSQKAPESIKITEDKNLEEKLSPKLENIEKEEPEIDNVDSFKEVDCSVKSEIDNSVNETQEFEFDDDFDASQLDELETENKTMEEDDSEAFVAEFEKKWEQQEEKPEETKYIDYSYTDLPMIDVDNKKVFRFYWWDAFEDPEKQKGVVFLFGKVYSNEHKKFVSCCVAVRDIFRHVFILPRRYILDENGRETDKPVTYKDLYMEVNNKIMKPMKIDTFKSRYTEKRYPFDPSVPDVSDYMEIRYPAKYPPPTDFSFTPCTFSKIFGANTSFMEIFLLERKIKGPCWLDIINPEPVQNPMSWCKYEVNCAKTSNVVITQTEKNLPPPPLTVMSLHLRSVPGKQNKDQICMISCVVQQKYEVDKKMPEPLFQKHFCLLCTPEGVPQPVDLFEKITAFKATKIMKLNSESAILNVFIKQFEQIDPDLIVGHDLQGYQINILADSLTRLQTRNFSKLGRLKHSNTFRLDRKLFLGRLVCDIKISAKELIKARSYDLDSIATQVLKLKEGQRIDVESQEILNMLSSSQNTIKLVSFTMSDAAFILQIMYHLNIIPLALQITNIAGNVMSKTLLGGRSERNEFLLLHAFTEKNFIVPDKEFKRKKDSEASGKKKPSYSGGLVLEPKVGFYDKYILLVDFNSLYPSIIQEYNICFTTMPPTFDETSMQLPDSNLPPGILPNEIRKLVQSRREVKKLMNNPDISDDLRMQYNIRQMALKLTANSMYGCLGFSNSRFYAKNLAALITFKGRDILNNTKELVEKMCYEVVYGDTDSLMINTNCTEYEQVMKIGNKIKLEVNKVYKQIELDIDGIFKYLLLLKKKKYAAVIETRTRTGEPKLDTEYKGLDIVRRDWSPIACEAGKLVLTYIFDGNNQDERISNIHNYLNKVSNDLKNNKVPLPLLIINKQLTKEASQYGDAKSLPHVQVAQRYNEKYHGHLRSGDTVPYVICKDGTDKPYTQRAYHVEEFKGLVKDLSIDADYYLEHQVMPIIQRICGQIQGTDPYQLAFHLGIDPKSYKARNVDQSENQIVSSNFVKIGQDRNNVEDFSFKCLACHGENTVSGPARDNVLVLEQCVHCSAPPVQYLGNIICAMEFKIKSFIRKYYDYKLICDEPKCGKETRYLPLKFENRQPVCTSKNCGVLQRQYKEINLYHQLSHYKNLFDIASIDRDRKTDEEIKEGYHAITAVIQKYLHSSEYHLVNLTNLFSTIYIKNYQQPNDLENPDFLDMINGIHENYGFEMEDYSDENLYEKDFE